jgi:hypothetical protein
MPLIQLRAIDEMADLAGFYRHGTALALSDTAAARNRNASEPSNEWHVHDYLPIGIFILLPIIVRQTQKIEGLDEPVSRARGGTSDSSVSPRANF